MTTIRLRAMEPNEWDEVADLIYDSTNAWCEANGRPRMFTRPKGSTRLFCSVYEDLDPGCCVVAEDSEQGRLAGSCFYHPRPTHVSLGIMNVHPEYFQQGIARRLLGHITDFADENAREDFRSSMSQAARDSGRFVLGMLGKTREVRFFRRSPSFRIKKIIRRHARRVFGKTKTD